MKCTHGSGLIEVWKKSSIVLFFLYFFSVTGPQTHTTLRPIICAKSAADFSHVIGRKVALVCAQITLSTQLIMTNYPVILFHRRSTTVSWETFSFILSDRLSFQSVAQINFNLTFLRAYAPSQSRGRTKEIKWSLKILNKQNKKVTLFPQAIQLPWVWQAYLGPFDSELA